MQRVARAASGDSLTRVHDTHNAQVIAAGVNRMELTVKMSKGAIEKVAELMVARENRELAAEEKRARSWQSR